MIQGLPTVKPSLNQRTKQLFLLLMCLPTLLSSQGLTKGPAWPDGTTMDKWFQDTARVDMDQLGKQYVVTDLGVMEDSTLVQTKALQSVIDRAAKEGGGVVVIPRGTFLCGSLFFRQGTHL